MLTTVIRMLLSATLADAFTSIYSVAVQKTNMMRIFASNQSEDNIDEKIRALNKMFGVDDETNEVLISSSKRRRILEQEIELLSKLHPDYLMEESSPDVTENNVVADLWKTWYGELGAKNERELRVIEEMLVQSGPSRWPEAEEEYLKLIEKHCGCIDGDDDGQGLNLSTWVEPANRLATLLYMMGRHEESKVWCERILDSKPWHIGALSGIVAVCAQLNDKEDAMKWAVKGMPRLSEETVVARKAWVESNVALAEQQLLELEKVSQNTMISSSGLKETMSFDKSNENDDMAWQ